MTLLAQLKSDRLQSRKNREAVKSTLLTTLLGELETDAKTSGKPITNDQVVAKSKKFIKSIEDTRSHVSDDSVIAELNEELAILNGYIPTQLSESALIDIINSSGATNLGAAMNYLKQNYLGQYDGAVASNAAKSIFASN